MATNPFDELIKMIQDTQKTFKNTTYEVLGDIKDDWVKEARDIAPIDSSNLRKQIDGTIEKGSLGFDSELIISSNAIQEHEGKTFNYAYYIHEGYMAKDGKHLRTYGTEEEFLTESLDEEKYKAWFEREINKKLKGLGW